MTNDPNYRPPVNHSMREKFDPIGKAASRAYFEARGYVIRDNQDPYGIDQFIYSGNDIIAQIECAVKGTWKNNINFREIEIPYKKIHHYKEYGGNVIFTYCNLYAQFVFVAKIGEILKHGKRVVINKGRGDEPWWVTPLEIWSFNHTNIIIKEENENVQLSMEFE